MKQIRYGSYEMTLVIDRNGQWRLSLERGDRVLIDAIPYHELSLAMILADALVDEEIKKETL